MTIRARKNCRYCIFYDNGTSVQNRKQKGEIFSIVCFGGTGFATSWQPGTTTSTKTFTAKFLTVGSISRVFSPSSFFFALLKFEKDMGTCLRKGGQGMCYSRYCPPKVWMQSPQPPRSSEANHSTILWKKLEIISLVQESPQLSSAGLNLTQQPLTSFIVVLISCTMGSSSPASIDSNVCTTRVIR